MSPFRGPDATLRIGCVAEVALQQVQSFVGALYASDPQLGIELRHLPSAARCARCSPASWISACSTAPGTSTASKRCRSSRASGSRQVLIGHRLARCPAVRPGDLRQEDLLTVPRRIDPAVHDALIARVRDAGHELRRVREWGGGDPRDILMAVAQGTGVALAPAPLLDTVGELATLVTPCPTDPPVRMAAIVLAWRAPAMRR